MERTITDLGTLQNAELGRTDPVLQRLRRQEEASRLAGFQGIARLCRDVGDCLSEARHGEQPRLAAEAATLSDVCRRVQLHAEAVGNSLARPGRDDEPGRTNARDAGHSTRPATTLE
ncbi:MAG: hypothetical protein A2V70_02700 [Planctomycetes bacterium RBG_13_63_9]|nr:MAG: hypothetical protein A2V70_02700 [Planctomycetes bacterium RBG_13_63_9]